MGDTNNSGGSKLMEATKENVIDKATVSFGVDGSVEIDHEYDDARSPAVMRKKIGALEAFLKTIPNAKSGNEACPLKHSFVNGLYVRQIWNPKGMVIVTKRHKVDHVFFLMQGDLTIATEDDRYRIVAPFFGVTKAGTKRVIFVNEEAIFVTVHATEATDVEAVEKEIIDYETDALVE